jgi:hypothetical protein
MKWTEGRIHVAMRRYLKQQGWLLIAGEYPGGSDHELYPLNVVDPTLARDNSPDPRRHSAGELIPDIVALNGPNLLIGEAKIRYNQNDRVKLDVLLTQRRADFLSSLRKFALERHFPQLLPVEQLSLHPVLVFLAGTEAPNPVGAFSHLRIVSSVEAFFEGQLVREPQ